MKMVALEAGQAAGGSSPPESRNVTRWPGGGGYYGSWRVLFWVGECDTYPSWSAGPGLVRVVRCADMSGSVTFDRCVHLLREVDKQAATKLEAVRAATRLAS
jgi:hypothetical protein